MQTLCRNGGQAGVGVAKDKVGIWLQFGKQLITSTENVAAGHTEVIPHHGHKNIRSEIPRHVFEFKVFPENRGKILIPVLVVVDHAGVEILTAPTDHRRKANDLRTGSETDANLDFSVILPFEVHIISPRQDALECR